MNVFMMPQEPGKAVSNADVKETPKEGYTERVPFSELFMSNTTTNAQYEPRVPPPTITYPVLPLQPKEDGILTGADMLWLRKMVRFEMREVIREELAQAVERFFARELSRLESAIHAEPHDEQEEIAAILATLKPEELEAIIAKVRGVQTTLTLVVE